MIKNTSNPTDSLATLSIYNEGRGAFKDDTLITLSIVFIFFDTESVAHCLSKTNRKTRCVKITFPLT